MSAVTTLEREHALIQQALDLLAGIAAGLEQDHAVERENIAALLAFFRDFADRRHHAKEEETLFPLLEQRGIARVGGPIGVMLHEHEQGRTMVRIMEGLLPELAVPGDGRQQFTRVANAYGNLLRNHIAKENDCLFPMAQTVLTNEDRQTLEAAFAQQDRNADDDNGFARYQSIIAALSAQLGATAPTPTPG
ncbi:hemerythrin domain-containing protein [Methylogaea oryzae]|uniref:Cation-binding protein n=1 Tax=Methylogaea oryzae TaxID=1295382 RepID=A0A8D4VP73_9GAMM|nr:hemerythrin domain-containing protein [Methylogaea oryzae]BBL70137.1 cation-binding protein [Methylogaea oryzae]